MSKIKIHEIAKKLGINSKEVLEKALELGIDVKTHLSSIDENDAKKIESNFNSEKKEPTDKIIKRNNPVIIRREVIIANTEGNKTEGKRIIEKKQARDIGFIEKQRKTDYNIVYRNKPNRPPTASELFGTKILNKGKLEKRDGSSEIPSRMVNNNFNKISKNTQVHHQAGSVNNINPQSKIYSNKNNLAGTFNRDKYASRNNPNRQYNKNIHDGRTQYNNYNNSRNRQFNKSNMNNTKKQEMKNQNYYGRRPLDEKGIEKNIKNIMSADIIEKESVIEYANRFMDRQKNNRYEEKNIRRTPRNKRGNYDEISNNKLKDLKQENRLSSMFDEGTMFDYYDLTTVRGKRSKKKLQQGENRVKQKIFELKDITIPETISVKDLSLELKKTSSEIIKKLLNYGILATINNEVDFDTAFLISGEFGVTAHKKEVVSDEDILFDESADKEEELVSRPPVVVVMGHVDHGKTSLLDAIRSTNVIEGEAGGITQHIGAYKVEINEREITFLDTPGHEAFTAMRARGAQITDIAILVVAANEGIMPQTIEAINHAKAAGIPIIVAINKIDLEGANPEKIKQELAEYGLLSEEWGGDTIFVPISAKKKINIDNLLEMVLLVADMKELKVNPKKQAKGVVIEAKLDKLKGSIATMLVQRGTLDVGDTILVGSVIGRIRMMTNDKGQKVKMAGPSTPVEITGLTEVPKAGETFYEVKDEKTAKHLMERRKRQARDKLLHKNNKVTLDDLFNQIEEGNLKELNIIVKADVQGSVEVVKQSLEKLSNNEVKVKVIHANVGAVTESDVTLANVSNAIIIAFNVRPEPIAKDMAEKDNVQIKTYSVIYNAIDDVEAAMKGMLEPVFKETVIGNAEVRQIFKISHVGTVAGCYVTEGKVERNAGVRVLRDNVVIHEGKLISLKRMKDDAKEVVSGYECGLQVENYNDIKEGDNIEVYIMEQIKQ